MRRAWLALFLLIGAGLLGWSLRRFPLEAAFTALTQIRGETLVALLLCNGTIIWLNGWRWWVIVRGMGGDASVWQLTLFRLAGFALSYVTPGQQFGGEPVQVLLAADTIGSTATAAASVAVERLLELGSNLIFLALGLTFSAQLLFTTRPTWPLWLLLVVGAVIVMLLWRVRPSRFVGRFISAESRLQQALRQTEATIARFFNRSQRHAWTAVGLSLVIWLLLVVEFLILLNGLNVLPESANLLAQVATTIAVLTAARLAFLAPTPGAVGALEASQIVAFEAVGLPPALAIPVVLVIRARDLLLTAIGLLAVASSRKA